MRRIGVNGFASWCVCVASSIFFDGRDKFVAQDHLKVRHVRLQIDQSYKNATEQITQMLRLAVVMRAQRDCDFRGGTRDAPTVVIETTLNGDVGAFVGLLSSFDRPPVGLGTSPVCPETLM